MELQEASQQLIRDLWQVIKLQVIDLSRVHCIHNLPAEPIHVSEQPPVHESQLSLVPNSREQPEHQQPEGISL